MRGDHFTRQWRLLRLVSRPSGVTVADGTRELGCSVRTVWRDLRALQDAGFPIYGDDDEDGGRQSVWRVHTDFHDRLPFPITLDEVVALLLSERFLAPARLSPLGPAIGSLVQKLRALLAPAALAVVDRMATRVGVHAPGAKLDARVTDHVPAIQVNRLTTVLSSPAAGRPDGIDRRAASRRTALATAPSRRTSTFKPDRTGTGRRA